MSKEIRVLTADIYTPPALEKGTLEYERYSKFLVGCYKEGFVADCIRTSLEYSTRHPQGYDKYKSQYDLDKILFKRYDFRKAGNWERMKVYS